MSGIKADHLTVQTISELLTFNGGLNKAYFEMNRRNDPCFVGKCDKCDTLLILSQRSDGQYECPLCDGDDEYGVPDTCESEVKSERNDTFTVDFSQYDPLYITNYTWKVPVKNQVDGKIELLTPHTEKEYEYPIDFIFDTIESALDALDMYDVRQEAREDDWVLVETQVKSIINPLF